MTNSRLLNALSQSFAEEAWRLPRMLMPKDWAIDALRHCFTWSLDLATVLHCEAKNPRRAALAWLSRLEKKHLLHSQVMDCHRAELGDDPLCTSSEQANVHRLAYQLELRFAGASRSTRIYWPSEEFAKRYGSATGTEDYPAPHKVSHDLLVTKVWLRYWQQCPELLVRTWVSERMLPQVIPDWNTRGPQPDAALCTDGKVVIAIEVGGHYPATWLWRHIAQFECAGWEWQLW